MKKINKQIEEEFDIYEYVIDEKKQLTIIERIKSFIKKIQFKIMLSKL